MIRPPPPTPLTLNLAPMVDVMMCLLIFFMLATKMVERERTRIDLPSAASAEDTRPDAASRRLVISVLRGVDGTPSFLMGDESLSRAQLLERFVTARQDNPDLGCVIRADRGLAYHDVESIFAECARHGVTRVRLGALREGMRTGP